jgi:2C-methyl-D-erythritol 2,4-cyclodiphosphate synthase
MPSLQENIDAVVGAIGTQNIGIVWGLSNVKWSNVQDRDDFLQNIINREGG